MCKFILAAAGFAAAMIPISASAQSFHYRGGVYAQPYGHGQRAVRREIRECRRELRRADSRREYRRELRECRREINRAHRQSHRGRPYYRPHRW